MLASCLLLGFGAMALNTAANTLIPKVLFEGKDPAAALNLGNVAFGVGLLLAPLMMSYLFRKTSYENTVSAVALVILAPLAVGRPGRLPEPGRRGLRVRQGGVTVGQAGGAGGRPGAVLLLGSGRLFQQLAAGVRKRGARAVPARADPDAIDASAQRLISVYAVAIICGRLVASQMPLAIEYAQKSTMLRGTVGAAARVGRRETRGSHRMRDFRRGFARRRAVGRLDDLDPAARGRPGCWCCRWGCSAPPSSR